VAFFLLIMKEIIFAEAQALNGVADFHHLFDLPVQTTPQIPDVKRCELRVSLLQEELNELKEAIQANDIVAAADAFCDLQYVLSGAILEFGLGEKFAEMFTEVQRSNMSKACPDQKDAEASLSWYKIEKNTDGYLKPKEGKFILYRTEDNKVLKSISYSPANLQSILTK
jgi:predicted HAD superfamily Cof-like phosphohydrolase